MAYLSQLLTMLFACVGDGAGAAVADVMGGAPVDDKRLGVSPTTPTQYASPAQSPVEQSVLMAGFQAWNCASVRRLSFSIEKHESPLIAT